MTDHMRTTLVAELQDAHAMETSVADMLDGMIEVTEDPEMLADLRHHRDETRRHEQLVAARLAAYGEESSKVKDLAAHGGAFLKGLVDMARDRTPAQVARDGFMTEHLEIAAYEELERLAERASDEETAEVARRNRADEEAMAQKISQSWDKVVDLTLQKEGAIASR